VLVAAAHPCGLARLPAHDAVDDSVGDPEDEQDSGRCVAGVVKAALAHPRSLQQVLPPVEVGVRVQGFADRRGEDVALLRPEVPSESALSALLLLVPTE
jgi:hypothetical protein